MKHPPLVLAILDGWGLREDRDANAIALARTPNYDAWLENFPHTALDASGHSVGLPAGIMGNSEVGHLNIGAGRIAQVGLTRIYAAIESGDFFRNPVLQEAFRAAERNQSTLHLLGLVSDGAVHSHQDHLYALLTMARSFNIPKIAVHAFTDGRDTDPRIALTFLNALEVKIAELPNATLGTIQGRYYAMDRDQRWERTQKSYDAMTLGLGATAISAEDAIAQAYDQELGDEFVPPTVLLDVSGNARALVQDGDSLLFFNFRADRARQLTRAFTEPNFSGFPRGAFPKISLFTGMAEYDASFGLPAAFPPLCVKNTLGKILAERGLRQLRVAETEKYAHVTFFFNGGEERPFPGEERILIPSPREVATYDLKPEMSAGQVADQVVAALEAKRFDVIILNFANPDMVGHTGKLDAAIQAVEVIDTQLGRIANACLAQGGTLLVSADHGNCERMLDAKATPHTAHTTNFVPFLLIGEDYKKTALRKLGTLADIAPTMLEILGIPQPAEMTGVSLLKKEG